MLLNQLLSENLKNKAAIERYLEENFEDYKSYEITELGIDIQGDLTFAGFTGDESLPYKFNRVTGTFDAVQDQLRDFRNYPNIANKIKILGFQGASLDLLNQEVKEVSEIEIVSSPNLTNLEGCPTPKLSLIVQKSSIRSFDGLNLAGSSIKIIIKECPIEDISAIPLQSKILVDMKTIPNKFPIVRPWLTAGIPRFTQFEFPKDMDKGLTKSITQFKGLGLTQIPKMIESLYNNGYGDYAVFN